MDNELKKTQAHPVWIVTIANLALLTAGLIALSVGALTVIRGDSAKSSTFLAGGLILLFAATIDRFESLKGLGIEAKTRQLDKKIEQADESLARLKELAELTGASLMNLNSKVGRMNSAPNAHASYALAQQVREVMLRMGSTPQAIQSILKPWVRVTLLDLGRVILAPLEKAIKERLQELHNVQQKIKQPIDPTDPIFLNNLEMIRTLSSFNENLRKDYEWDLQDYPENILKAIKETPYISEDLRSIFLQKAQGYWSAMIELRDNFHFSDPEPILTIIDSNRH